MKRWNILILSVLVLSFVSAPAFAQQPASTDTDKLKNRLEERKTRLKIKLSVAESQRITARCAAAQQKIGALGNKEAEIITKYQAFNDRIEKLEQTLSSNDQKSSELLVEVGQLKAKYEVLNKAVSDFNQALSDTKTLDCVKDPAAFKASLEDTRTAALSVHKQRAELLSYIQGTVKPTLQSLKDNRN